MAEPLQHCQAALIARISTFGTTDDEPILDTARSGCTNAIISQSRWYKISVRPVADALLSHAADAGMDFIVMGGYGHSRLREFVLGGVTRSILRSMAVPVLMSH
jgi:nucleotide-binding universal stress UspA family protein